MSSEATAATLIDFKISMKNLQPFTIRAIAVQQFAGGCVIFHNEKGEAVCIVPVTELVASIRLDSLVADAKPKPERGSKASS